MQYWPPTNTSPELTVEEQTYLDVLWNLYQKQAGGSDQPGNVHLTIRDVLRTMGRKNSNAERSKLSRCIFHAEALNIQGPKETAEEGEPVDGFSPILVVENAQWELWRGERLLAEFTFHFGIDYFERRQRGEALTSGHVFWQG